MCHSNPVTASKKTPNPSIFSAYLTCKPKKPSNPAIPSPWTHNDDQQPAQEG